MGVSPASLIDPTSLCGGDRTQSKELKHRAGCKVRAILTSPSETRVITPGQKCTLSLGETMDLHLILYDQARIPTENPVGYSLQWPGGPSTLVA